MTIYVTLLFCMMATDHDVCQQVSPDAEFASMQECSARSQQLAAAWVGEHPEWTFTGATCTADYKRTPKGDPV